MYHRRCFITCIPHESCKTFSHIIFELYSSLRCKGYLLRHQDHRKVIGTAVMVNNFFTLLWALTPVDMTYSIHIFIALRFIMGLTQCVMCVFLPLWTNQFAPKDKKTSWMGYLQVMQNIVHKISVEYTVS